jgi:hypothetical protein
MQNEQTLIELGFDRYPEWDSKDTGTKHYFKVVRGKVFRAYEVTCNGPVYVTMGEVSTLDGKVKRWMDCCSEGSVHRKLLKVEQLQSRQNLLDRIADGLMEYYISKDDEDIPPLPEHLQNTDWMKYEDKAKNLLEKARIKAFNNQ